MVVSGLNLLPLMTLISVKFFALGLLAVIYALDFGCFLALYLTLCLTLLNYVNSCAFYKILFKYFLIWGYKISEFNIKNLICQINLLYI